MCALISNCEVHCIRKTTHCQAISAPYQIYLNISIFFSLIHDKKSKVTILSQFLTIKAGVSTSPCVNHDQSTLIWAKWHQKGFGLNEVYFQAWTSFFATGTVLYLNTNTIYTPSLICAMYNRVYLTRKSYFSLVRESTDGPNCNLSLVLNKNGDI